MVASAAVSSCPDAAGPEPLQMITAVCGPVRPYPSCASARARLSGAPSSNRDTAARRSAWAPRVSSARSVAIRALTAATVSSMNVVIDSAETSSSSRSCAGSSVSRKQISIHRRQATPCAVR
jgi:hypothetical protein